MFQAAADSPRFAGRARFAPRPFAVVQGEVAEVVESHRAVPGVADLIRDLGQLLVDRSSALPVAGLGRGLGALAKSGSDAESVAGGGGHSEGLVRVCKPIRTLTGPGASAS